MKKTDILHAIISVLAIMAGLWLTSCATLTPALDEAAKCAAEGKEWHRPGVCLDKPEPGPEPGAGGTPQPEPHPDPIIITDPAPDPDPGEERVFGPYTEHQFYTFDHVNTPGGKVSFWISGLAASSSPHDTEGFIFMAMGRGAHGGEMNLQLMILYNTEKRHVEARLVAQRFGDPACLRVNQKHCESADYIDSTQEPELDFNPFLRYLVIIEWNAKSAKMTITPEGGRAYTWAGPHDKGISTWEGFASYDWIRVGNGVYTKKPGYQRAITIINPEYEAM